MPTAQCFWPASSVISHLRTLDGHRFAIDPSAFPGSGLVGDSASNIGGLDIDGLGAVAGDEPECGVGQQEQ